MAGLNDRGRGQLILLTGLSLAVVMVAFVFLLNTAIATQHLATQGLADDGTDTLSYRNGMADGAGDLIEAENAARYGTQADVEANVTAGLDRVDTLTREHTLRQGTWTEATTVRVDSGGRLAQTDANRNFTSASGATTWTLATDTYGVRAFTVDASGDLLGTLDPEANSFNVSVVGGGSNRWSLYIYEDALTGNAKLAVKNGTEGTLSTDVCSPGQAPTIDLTAGTVDGEPCTAIQFAKGVSAPYDVIYTNGDSGNGTYALTVNTTVGTVQSANFGTGSGPSEWPAVYAAVLDLEYESDTLTYRERVRIARGEP